MGVSNDVSIGDTIEAAQYVDLRTDVNDDALSHDHSAAGRNGKKIGLSGLLAEVTDKLGQNIGLVSRVSLTTASTSLVALVAKTGGGRVLGVHAGGTGARQSEIRMNLDGIIETITGVVAEDLLISNASADLASNWEGSNVLPSAGTLRELETFFKTNLTIDVRSIQLTNTFRAQYEGD